MALQESERRRFEALFREHHRAVQAFARRRVPLEAVDDVVAETFLVGWRRLAAVPDDALPWLLGVARNVVGTERRGRARRVALWNRAQDGFVETQEPVESTGSGNARVLAALSQLSETDREALILVAWDGLTPAQAAAALGIPPNRFRVRLHRAGRRLRSALDVEPRPERPGRRSDLSPSAREELSHDHAA